MAKFEKGKSGNPNGRPPKSRALTEILEAAGNKTVKRDGQKAIARKRLLADLMWQLVAEGKAELPNGKILQPDPKDWLETLKWIYRHIDGPPQTNIDMTSGGNVIKVTIGDTDDE